MICRQERHIGCIQHCCRPLMTFLLTGTYLVGSTKGKLACPICNKETSSYSLKHGRTVCYMCHRRFLPPDHCWQRKYKEFDGKREQRLAPKWLSGDNILMQLESVKNAEFGKGSNKKKRKWVKNELNWRKKSIFWELPYWRTLKLRHNLDVMHIEKNICDNVLGTLMNIEGKTKDNMRARMDLKEMCIKKELHLIPNGDKCVVPPSCYTMFASEKKSLREWLKLVKFPDGFASNISRCVNINECKISGMKSRDCHVFLQRLLPVAIHGYLRKDVCNALVELGLFFKELCCKKLKLKMLEQMKNDIVIIICKLEKIFSLTFFDVIVHLAIHLPREAILAGPLPFWWIFPIER